jgi:hypothetical protein
MDRGFKLIDLGVFSYISRNIVFYSLNLGTIIF